MFSRKKGVYVRVVNSGDQCTLDYNVSGHIFPGLKPGDTTQYQFFKRFNKCDRITVRLELYSEGEMSADCDDDFLPGQKITVYINAGPKPTGGSDFLLLDFHVDK